MLLYVLYFVFWTCARTYVYHDVVTLHSVCFFDRAYRIPTVTALAVQPTAFILISPAPRGVLEEVSPLYMTYCIIFVFRSNYTYSSTLLERPPLETSERWSLTKGNVIWGINACVIRKAGLTGTVQVGWCIMRVVSHIGYH